MVNLGDFDFAETIIHSFTLVDNTGAPVVLEGTPSLAIYKNASATPNATPVTLTTDVNSQKFSRAEIDTDDEYFDGTGSDVYHLVIAAGTADGVSVAGYVIASFTIGRTARLLRNLFKTETETGMEFRKAMRLQTAAAAAVLSGAVRGEAGTIVIRNPANTKDRITATVDANGNRLTTSYDLVDAGD